MKRIFLLSPAHCGGKRASFLLEARSASCPLLKLRADEGAPLGEVFGFLSALYFRGKLAYASRFALPPQHIHGVFVITPTRGLLTPDEPITLPVLQEFAGGQVDVTNARYREPLQESARRIALAIESTCCKVILLGSIATEKYSKILVDIFKEKLLFPAEFVGRGDMSRGGLLLRCVRMEKELTYVSFLGSSALAGTKPKRNSHKQL